MNDFCATHVVQQTTTRLLDRKTYLESRAKDNPLTSGLAAQLERVKQELDRRASSK